MTDLISIIVPIYNVEKYLEKCLNSIINQSYKNVEIILIDDGSHDDSLQICNKYAQNDKRIILLRHSNHGVAYTRNIGLKHSNGKYICFIDPDDEVDEKYIEKIYTNLIKYDADISICGFEMVYSEKKKKLKKICYKTIKYDKISALKELLYQKSIDNSLCWKIFKKDLFDHIEFPNNYIFEDFAVVYKLFLKSEKVILTNEPLYFYYQRPNSIMHQEKFKPSYFDILKISDKMEYDIICAYPELENAVLCRKLNAYFFISRLIDKKKYSKEYKMIKDYIKKNRRRVLKDKNIKKKTKYGIILSYISLDLIRIIYRFENLKKIFYMR